MPTLTIGWEYITGYAVATDPGSRERAEWPPHPGRVFMALAAAWFETGEDPAEGDALRWLEAQDEPTLGLPPAGSVSERTRVTAYVPVNDKAGPSSASLQSAPALTRSKQPRTFPRVHVGSSQCHLYWHDATGVDEHRDAIESLCAKVTRIGHSSSLVRMWVADEREAQGMDCERWRIADIDAEIQLRRISPGFLSALSEGFGEGPRREQLELKEEVDSLADRRRAIKGRGSKDRKAEIDALLAPLKVRLEQLTVSPPVRPKIGLWTGYRRTSTTESAAAIPSTVFDPEVLVLAHETGSPPSILSSAAVMEPLRDAVMRHSGIQPVPEWVSGHQADGAPSRNDAGHMACIPMPFVGHQHADGRLLGAALVIPRSVDRKDRGSVLGPLLLDADGQPRPVALKLGALGVWTLKKRDWSDRRETLKPETWTAHPDGASVWSSATPLVLDRFPKADRQKDRIGWTTEVCGIIAQACRNIGLPEPLEVDIDATSWLTGSPRACPKRRTLRSSEGGGHARAGDGFTPFRSRGTGSPRPQIHVRLKFAAPVVGPVLLGAGRFQGYGLFKPLQQHDRGER